MKILHATKKYPDAIGGDAFVVSNLEKEQQRQGHEVFILTSRCRETIRKENVLQFGITDSPAGLDKISLKRILSLIILSITGFFLLNRLKPDIIHSHSPDIGFLLSYQAFLFNIPVINTCHGVTFSDDQPSTIKGHMELLLLKAGHFKDIVTVDRNSIPVLSRRLAKNIVYIPNGVDIKFFKNESTGDLSGPDVKFLFVGRLETQKGLKYLIQASEKLLKEISYFKLFIIGEGSLSHELVRMVNEAGLNEHISFTGRVDADRLRQYYHSCDVFILPSIWEGLPLTLLEAWTAGLPVIVTDVGDISHICKNRENALIVNPKDPDALCNAMLLLVKDKKMQSDIAKNGEKTVKSGYSWGEVTEEYIKIYNHIPDPS